MQGSPNGSITAPKIVVKVEEGLERMGLSRSFENVFAATKDEGADIAAAFWSTSTADVPCNAHVQQSIVQDIYVIDIKEPKPTKDGLGFKLSSGSRWPNGELLSPGSWEDWSGGSSGRASG